MKSTACDAGFQIAQWHISVPRCISRHVCNGLDRVAGRTEPGVRSEMLDKVVFGRNEPAPQHLHKGFAAALKAAREGRA